MRRGQIWSMLAVLVLAGLAAVASGCGAASIDPVAAAATKTQQAGAAKMSLSISFSSPSVANGKVLTLTGHGILDNANADVTLDLGSVLGAFGASANVPSTLREIVVQQQGNEVLYVSAGKPIVAGKDWVKLDLTQLAKGAGLGAVGSASQPGLEDPTQILDFLKAHGSQVQDLGSATVDGAATTHYRVTIDVPKLLAKAAATNPLLQRAVASIDAKSLPEDVWIGQDGLLRRLRVDYSLSANHVAAHLTVALDLTDYGTSATVSPPAAADVFDATSFLSAKLATSGLFK